MFMEFYFIFLHFVRCATRMVLLLAVCGNVSECVFECAKKMGEQRAKWLMLRFVVVAFVLEGWRACSHFYVCNASNTNN